MFSRLHFSTISLLMFAGLLAYLFPIGWVISLSLRQPGMAFVSSLTLHELTLGSLIKALKNPKFFINLRNSFVIAFATGIGTTSIATLASYGISRFRFRGREALYLSLLSIRAYPPVILSVSYFALFMEIRLYDTLMGLVLLNVIMNSPLAIWILRNYMDSIPYELDEASMIDGANHFDVLWRITLPLCRPSLVTAFILSFILAWNNYTFAFIFLASGSKRPATVGIYEFITQYASNYIGLSAFSILLSVPTVVLFFLIQPFLLRGLVSDQLE